MHVLFDGEAGFEGAADRARRGGALEARDLPRVVVASEEEVDPEPARGDRRVVVDLDEDIAELPALRPRIHRDGVETHDASAAASSSCGAGAAFSPPTSSGSSVSRANASRTSTSFRSVPGMSFAVALIEPFVALFRDCSIGVPTDAIICYNET